MERDSLLYKIRRKGQIIAGKVFSDEFMCKLYSKVVLKKKIDLENPKTFNEKIQWSKIYYYPENPLVVKCADKYAVREYVEKKGLSNILVSIYGDWNKVEDVLWDSLPKSFVLKCNHGCAYNILCANKDNLDVKSVSKKLKGWLKEDFGAFNVEKHYSRIKPRKIICEEYLGDSITDYKFFCFNGEPKFIYVSNDLIHDRQAEIGFFYLDGTKMPLRRDDYKDIEAVTFPSFFDDMISSAKKLCEDFPFVRVDFFLDNERYYFAELTFTPGGGMMPFNPEKCDEEWGSLLDMKDIVAKYGKK